jgi:EmrB/QacA subfamily drug resistance transporter
MSERPTRPGLVLVVMCLAVFAVNVDTTIVNVTLPTLVRELGATTRDLQWIVDAYLLVFASLVLAAGSLSDRLGRRRMLVAGLVVFGAANAAAAFADTTGQLIAARAVAGLGAAGVFPATLAIITRTHRQRAERARAIGIWGAVAGLAVAFGPITGGALLDHFWWGSTFFVKLPIAALAVVLTVLWVPESRDRSAHRFDVAGLVLSAAGLGTLVYTLIEAPDRGWSTPATLAGFVVTALLFAAFAVRERRAPEPMLDLRLFGNRRFTAASLAVTVAFFSLFGFIFLITQYFQFVRGYGALEAGVRTLPVAASIAAGSVAGTIAVVRLGNRMVVTAGLLSLTVAYAWIATASATTSYLQISCQMVVLGLGMGLTSAPATESIMGSVSADKAGVGSAVNDAIREVGGTLGVAVIGSVFASFYAHALDALRTTLPGGVIDRATDSIGAATAVAAQVPGEPGQVLLRTARDGFLDGLHAGSLVAAGVALLGAIVVGLTLPAAPKPATTTEAERPTVVSR